MKKILLILGLFLSVSLLANEAQFYKPSFSCNNVKKESVEYKICSDKELAQLDTILSGTYQSFRLVTNEMKQEQRDWIKSRNKCKDNSCIKDRYQIRIKDLNTALSNQNTFPKNMLDIMRNSQKAVKVEFSKSKEKQAFAKDFFKDLYTFKNVKISKPIFYKLDYNNIKLQKSLGKNCVNMRLDFHIKVFKEYEPGGESARGVREYYADLANNYSLYKVDMDGDKQDEIMFVQYFNTFEYYNVIDKDECNESSYIPFPINCTDCSFECEKKSYPDIYFFYDNNKKRIHPYCTFKQKILGVQRVSSYNTETFVIRWKEKSYLIVIHDATNSYNPNISIMLYGTKKLNYLALQKFIMKKTDKKEQ